MASQIKTPPFSEEAEKSVLGCMMLDKDAIITAGQSLNDDDFYIDQNKWIFTAIKDIANRGFAVDYVTLIDKLNSEGLIEKIGASYIASLADIVPSTRNIEQYCQIVSEKAALRKMIITLGDIINECYEDKLPLSSIIDEAEDFIYNMSLSRAKSEFVSLREEIKPAIIKLGELYQSNTLMTGISTGYKEIDRITSGLQPSDMILIAARPSMGKTALGMNIAQNAAIRGGKTVAFFSLEMSIDSLILRIISSESEVNSTKIRVGRQNNAEWTKIRMFHNSMEESQVNLFIDDTSGISTGEVRSKLRKLKAKQGLDLVVIDFLQLMSVNKRTENRQQEIAAISRDLKAIAKELKCPVVALSQLSRSPESRSDRRPILSDLRESGAIEQDADLVMLLYRESYYDKTHDPRDAEVIIAKHRNGETGTIHLNFLGEYTKFIDAPPKQDSEFAL